MMESSKEYLVEHYGYLENFKKDFRNKNLFQLVQTYVHGDSIVDLGCGAGFFLSILQTKGKSVFGIEPNEGMRMLAQKVNPQVTVVSGFAEDITRLAPQKVDCITMLDVLEHVEDDHAQVARMFGVLQKDGTLVLVVPALPFLYGLRDKNMGHYRRYSKKGLVTLLVKSGFTIEKVRYWNALGVVPYFISEKILKRPLRVRLREDVQGGVVKDVMREFLNLWVRFIENRVNFGFGLSLICVARKKQ